MLILGPDDAGAHLAVVEDSAAALVAVGFASAELLAAGLAIAEFGDVALLDASRHPALVYLAGLAPGSRPTMRKALDIIARLLTGASFNKDGHLVDGIADHRSMPWQAVTYAHARAVRAELAGHYAHSTASKMLSALRGVATEAWRLGLMDGDTRARIVDVDGVKGTSIPAGRSLAGGELRALFKTCAEDPTPAGRRDAAMLALAYGCGLRRSELVALDLAHYDPLSATVAVVAAKGNKSRLAYPDGAIGEALAAWLAVRGTVRGTEPDPLLLAVNKGGRIIYGHRLSTTAVYAAAVKRQVAAAGVGRFSPHDLRRTIAGDWIDAGADIASVQQLLGHARVETTLRYDRRPEATRRKAASLVAVPYVTPAKTAKMEQAKPALPAVHQLKITLVGCQPPIWRRIQVLSGCSLAELHAVIQAAMGWDDAHGHRFVAGGWDSYGDGMTANPEEATLTLERVARAGDRLAYEYDFGDCWGHGIVVEKTIVAGRRDYYPVCLAGARACPPEDCGGPSGYERLVKETARRRGSEYRWYRELYGTSFRPALFDLEAVNRALREGPR